MLRDFSDTVAFVKVVQEGSFTAAAHVLKVPKTRVSRKVQELESRLRTQLLNRTTRSLKLTEAGAVYFQHCERVVKNLEDAENAVAELQQHPRGWLRIAASYWLATRVLAPLLTEFRRFYPEVFPQLLLGHEVVDLVAKDIDIAFRLQEGTLPVSTLTARRLGALPMGIYGAPTYLERAGTPQHPSELTEHACLFDRVLFQSSGSRMAPIERRRAVPVQSTSSGRCQRSRGSSRVPAGGSWSVHDQPCARQVGRCRWETGSCPTRVGRARTNPLCDPAWRRRSAPQS